MLARRIKISGRNSFVIWRGAMPSGTNPRVVPLCATAKICFAFSSSNIKLQLQTDTLVQDYSLQIGVSINALPLYLAPQFCRPHRKISSRSRFYHFLIRSLSDIQENYLDAKGERPFNDTVTLADIGFSQAIRPGGSQCVEGKLWRRQIAPDAKKFKYSDHGRWQSRKSNES